MYFKQLTDKEKEVMSRYYWTHLTDSSDLRKLSIVTVISILEFLNPLLRADKIGTNIIALPKVYVAFKACCIESLNPKYSSK